MLVRCRRSSVDYQRWYNVEKQLAQPYSNCGKSNLTTVDVQGPSSVYSAPVVDCQIPASVQCWLYNRPNLISTVEKIIYRQWMSSIKKKNPKKTFYFRFSQRCYPLMDWGIEISQEIRTAQKNVHNKIFLFPRGTRFCINLHHILGVERGVTLKFQMRSSIS